LIKVFLSGSSSGTVVLELFDLLPEGALPAGLVKRVLAFFAVASMIAQAAKLVVTFAFSVEERHSGHNISSPGNCPKHDPQML